MQENTKLQLTNYHTNLNSQMPTHTMMFSKHLLMGLMFMDSTFSAVELTKNL